MLNYSPAQVTWAHLQNDSKFQYCACVGSEKTSLTGSNWTDLSISWDDRQIKESQGH